MLCWNIMEEEKTTCTTRKNINGPGKHGIIFGIVRNVIKMAASCRKEDFNLCKWGLLCEKFSPLAVHVLFNDGSPCTLSTQSSLPALLSPSRRVYQWSSSSLSPSSPPLFWCCSSPLSRCSSSSSAAFSWSSFSEFSPVTSFTHSLTAFLDPGVFCRYA